MITLAIIFLLGGFGYLIRGGSRVFTGKEIPGARYVGCAVATLAYSIYVITYNQSLWLIPVFAIGWFLTIMRGWNKYYDCSTWTKRADFYNRMYFWSLPLWFSICAIKDGITLRTILDVNMLGVLFSVTTVLAYTVYNKLPGKWRGDEKLNWSEFVTGLTIIGLAML